MSIITNGRNFRTLIKPTIIAGSSLWYRRVFYKTNFCPKQFLATLFIDNVKPDHPYVVRLANDHNATRLRTKKTFDRVNHWTLAKKILDNFFINIAYCEIVLLLVKRTRVYDTMR